MTISLPSLTLVVGGAASGKSAYAERLLAASARPMVYVATAQSFDDEMRDKIDIHQMRRGENWRTIEAPMDLTDALATIPKTEAVLIDCATMWLTNQLLAEAHYPRARKTLFDALATCNAPVIMVSNEVGAGIVPENALARQFRQAQGELNQMLAAEAQLVVTVIAGLPLALKGKLPELAG